METFLVIVSSIAMAPFLGVIMNLRGLLDVPHMSFMDGVVMALIHFILIAFNGSLIWVSFYWLMGVGCIVLFMHGYNEIKEDFTHQ